jgi:hypothetical protein
MEKAAVLAALDSLGVDSACPFCRARAWNGIGPDGAELPVKLLVVTDAETTSSDNLPPGVRCAALICGRCGYVSLHAESVLRKAM